jgi:hypothetical protein
MILDGDFLKKKNLSLLKKWNVKNLFFSLNFLKYHRDIEYDTLVQHIYKLKYGSILQTVIVVRARGGDMQPSILECPVSEEMKWAMLLRVFSNESCG